MSVGGEEKEGVMQGEVTLEKLQEKLNDVYDLRDTSDCHAVIRMLLRDVEGSKARENKYRVQLRSLAAAVLGEYYDAKEKARDALSSSSPKECPVNVMGFISKMAVMMKYAEDMTDEKLASEVLDRVWANLDMSSGESALLGEMMERFKGEKAKIGGVG